MAKLEILIGNIASGKSTYAKKRAAEGWLVVCDDDIILMLLGHRYQLYKTSMRGLVLQLMQDVTRCLILADCDVVVDSTWNADYPVYEYWKTRFTDEVLTKVFPREASEVHAARRMLHDSRGISYHEWLEVAQRIGKSIEEWESRETD